LSKKLKGGLRLKDNRIIAIYLAAGNSRRMGVNKLALQLGTTTIGNSTFQRAVKSELEHIIVVTRVGDALEWMDTALFRGSDRNRWTTVTCLDAEKGQAHSLQCGLRAAMEMNPKGMMILLADQPLLPVSIINDLILRYGLVNQDNGNIGFVAASFQGTPRPPIIFSPDAVPELLKLKGDEGARQLFRMKTPMEGILIDYDNARAFIDIDTKEEYEWLTMGDKSRG
jgi:molybdenum cofactor cytidylyltransferase